MYNMPMISVLSYNVHFGKRLEKIIYWLLQKQTYDIICFQEFPKHAIQTFLRAFSTATYGYRFAPFLLRRGKTYGELTVFRKSKLNLIRSTTVFLGINRGERVMLRARIPRTSLITVFKFKNKIITVVNIHLVNVAFNALRYKQITKIVDKLNLHITSSVLVGDFNLPSLFGRKKLFALMDKNGYSMQKKRLSTHHFVGIKHQMDYIFWKECSVLNLSVERVKFSDHYPVTFHVSLR
jgi:endonuclease/exonuclease/phosphatase family metal-dependent hydrolase